MGEKTKRFEILLDEETVEGLEKLQAAFGVSRGEAVRRAVKESVAVLEKGKRARDEAPRGEDEPVRSGKPTLESLGLMTARQLAVKQAREREGRRGDESGDQRSEVDEL